MNLFTHERINLPPLESQLGTTKVERSLEYDGKFCVTSHQGNVYKGMSIRSPVLWIDETSKDYLVLWGIRDLCVCYSRKRDNSWNQIPETSYCCDMVYKDSKLYFLSLRRMFRIYDFSGEIPKQTFHCGVNVESFYFGLGIHGRTSHWGIVATKLVVTVTGEVLKVEQLKSRSQTRSFRVFKVYSSGFVEKKELVHSLGDESMLLDQGITVLASDTDGLFIKNSIYFSVNEEKNVHDMFLFNLETKKTEPLHKFDSSLVRFSTSRWFLPSFR